MSKLISINILKNMHILNFFMVCCLCSASWEVKQAGCGIIIKKNVWCPTVNSLLLCISLFRDLHRHLTLFLGHNTQVVHSSLNGGRPCGELVEHKVCSQPCEAFRWVASGWSECQLIAADRNRGCGTGDQYRQVRWGCMRHFVIYFISYLISILLCFLFHF